MSELRGRSDERDDEVHAVRAECSRLRTREECIAEGRHLVERDAFTGLHYCRWCGFPE